MKKIGRISLLMTLLYLVTGCSEINLYDSEEKLEKENLEILDIKFAEDYKTFHVDVRLKDGVMFDNLVDLDKLEVVGIETRWDSQRLPDDVQPTWVNSKTVLSEEVTKRGLHTLVLVDLTLDEKRVEKQKVALKNLSTLFIHDNLFVAFMKENTVSETYPVTDYVFEHFFEPSPSGKKLYRSILSKKSEMAGGASAYFPVMKQDTVFPSLPASQKMLVVFSDGQTYQDNQPIDAQHFDLQQELMKVGKGQDASTVYYVHFGKDSDEDSDEETEEVENEAENMMKMLCRQTGGKYFQTFAMNVFLDQMLETKNHKAPDMRVNFTNPDYKVYNGNKRRLILECSLNDSLIMTGHIDFSRGSVYRPIIVNGTTTWEVIVQGAVIFVVLLSLIYLVLQYIVPRVRYELFKKKFVIKYTGKNMSSNNIQIDDSCYYCKSPFEIGEEIVVKCEHVMHKSCWDENGYKCPEYGRRCQSGSHYYNWRRIYDSRNASFYMNWLLMGIVAGFCSWYFFIVNVYRKLNYELLINNLFSSIGIDVTSEDVVSSLERFGYDIYYAPSYGFYICFFLTLFMSMLSSHGQWWWKRTAMVIGKAIVSALCGYFSFLIAIVVSMALHITGNDLLVDWIPWAINGFFVTFVVAYRTDIQLKKALLGAAFSVFFGLVSMYLWRYTQSAQIDTRDMLLLSNLIYSIGLSLSLAFYSPKSERYFLKVEGAVKTMEIALYKWMNSQSCNHCVTIGKSVDCNLQMSWDVNSAIAPVQAEILSSYGNIYLKPLEEGVFMDGKPLKVDKKIRLYHGTKFAIGQTIFTYVERDI